MDIILEKVEEGKKDILYRLLQYSLFEESISDQNDMNEEALFEYPWFGNYFTEEGRDACFIREQETGRLLGFIMINTHVQKWDSGYSIAEFMILPKFRRNKIGRKAAVACFDRYAGNWEVSPSYGNFWQNIYTSGRFFNHTFVNKIFNIPTGKTCCNYHCSSNCTMILFCHFNNRFSCSHNYHLLSIDFCACYYIYMRRKSQLVCLLSRIGQTMPTQFTSYSNIFSFFLKSAKKGHHDRCPCRQETDGRRTVQHSGCTHVPFCPATCLSCL